VRVITMRVMRRNEKVEFEMKIAENTTPVTNRPDNFAGTLITDKLQCRTSREPDFETENRALDVMTRALGSPGTLLQTLVETCLKLCRAESSGLSLLEHGAFFRWHAVTGKWAHLAGAGMPRVASPCGAVLERGKLLLFANPGRYFPEMAKVNPLAVEALLVPFYSEGVVVGTVWVVTHTPGRTFDAEDARVLKSLSGFAASWYAAERQIASRTRELSDANAALRVSEAALRESDRRKDEFLATLAHELRNPLAPISSALAVLRAAPDKNARPDLFEIMARQLNHMVHLVNELLEVSRVTRGILELQRVQIDLATIIKGAVETSGPLIKKAKHRLHVAVPAEPLILDADPVRLEQVFSNLLNNAVKFMPEGGDIWLLAWRDNDEAVITIRDKGIGIAPEQQARIFEMFTQVLHSGDGGGGLGIGLALTRSLLQLHGGRIQVESAGVGKGAEFTVTLPISSTIEVNTPIQPSAQVDLHQRRILIVDDNNDAADSTAGLLESWGAEVKVAYNGKSGLELLESFHPQVVILDLGMPVMSGYDVARQIRSRPEFGAVTLVALSGWGQMEDRNKSSKAGFDYHLVKPADLKLLAKIMTGTERKLDFETFRT